MPLPSLTCNIVLCTWFTFRVALQKDTSGWPWNSCACGQHLEGPCLHLRLLWQEDLPAAIWRNRWHMQYRRLFTAEQCWFAWKMLDTDMGRSETSPWLQPGTARFCAKLHVVLGRPCWYLTWSATFCSSGCTPELDKWQASSISDPSPTIAAKKRKTHRKRERGRTRQALSPSILGSSLGEIS